MYALLLLITHYSLLKRVQPQGEAVVCVFDTGCVKTVTRKIIAHSFQLTLHTHIPLNHTSNCIWMTWLSLRLPLCRRPDHTVVVQRSIDESPIVEPNLIRRCPLVGGPTGFAVPQLDNCPGRKFVGRHTRLDPIAFFESQVFEMFFVELRGLCWHFPRPRLPFWKRIGVIRPCFGPSFQFFVCEEARVKEGFRGRLFDSCSNDNQFLPSVTKRPGKIFEYLLHLWVLPDFGVVLQCHFKPHVGVKPRTSSFDPVQVACIVPFSDAVVARRDP